MKIKEMLGEAYREELGLDIERGLYTELFVSDDYTDEELKMLGRTREDVKQGVLVVGDYDGTYTFQEDGIYYVAIVDHSHFWVSGLQECSKLLYDELMKLKHYV
jgi:hypothetical protein